MRGRIGWSRGGAAAAAGTACAVAAVLVGWALLAGCRGGSLPRRSELNVLLITLDTTRRDHLGCYGYRGVETPALDGLAREGVLFEDAVSPVPLTCPSHSSMLTGLFPPQHGVRSNGGFSLKDTSLTLAEILKEEGYRTGGFISAYVLHRVFGLNQGFDTYDDDLRGGQESMQEGVEQARERGAEAVTESALRWLREKPEQRFFLWVHYYDPHTPYRPPGSFLTRYLNDPYAGEIAYMDSEIARLLRALEELGLRRKTLIIAVGDHGESLWEHQESGHAFFVYDATLRIPLIVNCPPTQDLKISPGQRRGGQVRTVDLFPTILSILGIPSPEKIQGVTLLPFMAEKRDVPDLDLYCETLLTKLDYGWSDLIGVRTSRWKYIDAPTRELYDLGRDPWEIDNLAAKLPDQVEDMRRRLSLLLAGGSGQRPENWATMDMTDEMRRNLQSLGYLGGSGSQAAPETQASDSLGIRQPTGKDPKDAVPVFIPITDAMGAMFKRDWDETIRYLTKALEMEPDNKQALRLMGDCYKRKNLLGKAEEFYERVLAIEPGQPQVLNNLGAIYIELGQEQEALPLLQHAVAERASMADAHNNLGVALLNLGRVDEAMVAFREAITLDHELVPAQTNLATCYARQEMWEEAAKALEAALKIDPGNLDAQRSLQYARQQARARQARATGGGAS